MATFAGTLVTDILTRVRDPNAQMVATDSPPTNATGIAFVLQMLTIGQQFAARATKQPVNLFFLTTFAGVAVIDMTVNGPKDWMGRAEGLTPQTPPFNEVDGPVEWKALGRASRTWLTDVGTTVSWSPIGLTMFATFPTNNALFTLRYLPLLPTIPNVGTPMSLPDPFVEQAAQIAEMLCRIKTRQLTDMDNRLKDLKNALGIVDKLMETGSKAD